MERRISRTLWRHQKEVAARAHPEQELSDHSSTPVEAAGAYTLATGSFRETRTTGPHPAESLPGDLGKHGTTRSRANFFMNKFKKLGFIE
jgi:hypothetical protein